MIEKESKMESRKEPVLRIPESVRQDVLGYRASVAKFTSGQTKPISFKAYRVPMGIYEQRAEGKLLPICLAEIERRRSYFIGLLGERYGWIPEGADRSIGPAWLERARTMLAAMGRV